MTNPRSLLLSLLLALSMFGCVPKYDFNALPNNEARYRTSLAFLNDGKSALAVRGFELLRTSLGARDTLRSRALYNLGLAYVADKRYYDGASTLSEFAGTFDKDSLADDALLAAARAFRKLWPHHELDALYGESAKKTLERLLDQYPDSPLREEVFREDASLQEQFAMKLYEQAMDLWRDRMYESARIMFNEVVEFYPATEHGRQARFMIVESLKRLKWTDETANQCALLRQMYRDDPRVAQVCGVITSPEPGKH